MSFLEETAIIYYICFCRTARKDSGIFPKGNIDKEESEEEAAKRELKEETGISEIKIVKGFKEKMKYMYRWSGDLVDKEVIMFLGEVEDAKVKLSWEHAAFEWLPFDEAKKLLKDQKLQMLEKANEFLLSSLRNWTK